MALENIDNIEVTSPPLTPQTPTQTQTHTPIMDPFITSLYNKISQLEFENQRNSAFLISKLNNLEEKLSLPFSTMDSLQSQIEQFQPSQEQQPAPYQPTPQQQPVPLYLPIQPPQVFYQPPQPITITPSITYYYNNSYRYINGSPIPFNTRSISLGYEFNERWETFSKHLAGTTIDTLVLLDGFNQEILPGSLPLNIKFLHIGFVGNLVCFKKHGSIPKSVIELHLHDGCNIALTRYSLPNSVKVLHVYNVSEPLNKDSIGNSVEVLYIHDGFNKSLGHDIIPNTVHELHLGNIQVSTLSMPIGLCSLYLHNGFSLPITISTLSKNIKELHLFNLLYPLNSDSIPVSVRSLYLHDEFNQSLSLILPNALSSLYLFDITQPISTCYPPTLKNVYLKNYRHNLINLPKKSTVFQL